MKIKRNQRIFVISSVILLSIIFMLMLNINSLNVSGAYKDNTSVITRLNVSNVAPVITGLTFLKEGTTGDIILSEGGTINVRCNGTVNDTNGVADIDTVKGFIYRNSVSDSDDNNDHYTNASCTKVSTIDVTSAYYSCHFTVEFYADNGTWTCNMTANDTGGLSNSTITTNIIDPLYAIDVAQTEIDFGELAPLEISTDQNINITNFGNMDLTLAVRGYGWTDGDNNAMNCTVGSIPIAAEKYSLTSGTVYGSMTSLSGSFANVAGLTVYQRTQDSDTNNLASTNLTYWKIKPPVGTRGICNGTVVISAVSS